MYYNYIEAKKNYPQQKPNPKFKYGDEVPFSVLTTTTEKKRRKNTIFIQQRERVQTRERAVENANVNESYSLKFCYVHIKFKDKK